MSKPINNKEYNNAPPPRLRRLTNRKARLCFLK
jgi:hypothetical protein